MDIYMDKDWTDTGHTHMERNWTDTWAAIGQTHGQTLVRHIYMQVDIHWTDT